MLGQHPRPIHPKPDEIGPEPQASQFTDVNEYAKALKTLFDIELSRND